MFLQYEGTAASQWPEEIARVNHRCCKLPDLPPALKPNVKSGSMRDAIQGKDIVAVIKRTGRRKCCMIGQLIEHVVRTTLPA